MFRVLGAENHLVQMDLYPLKPCIGCGKAGKSAEDEAKAVPVFREVRRYDASHKGAETENGSRKQGSVQVIEIIQKQYL